jgi:hypothetical protein
MRSSVNRVLGLGYGVLDMAMVKTAAYILQEAASAT